VIVLSLLLGLAAAVLLLPTTSDLISLGRVLLGHAGRRPRLSSVGHPRLLFLVPAHNEQLLIEACVRSLTGLRYPPARYSVVVIADNCADRTAALARTAGARCLERHDAAHPGKPRAIAWALEQLPVREYDAVVIVDADTMVDVEFAAELAKAGPLAERAVQGFFDLSNPTESAITRMAGVLATATHRFAYRLKQRSGINVPLVGNGMAIGTQVLARHGWQAFSICEDWEMYALLTERGVPIVGAPSARLYAQEAQSLGQSSSQRERWTAGRLTVLARIGPRLLGSGDVTLRQKLDSAAELTAPGPALHLGITLLLAALALSSGVPGAPMLAWALGASLIRPVGYTIAALVVQPDPWRTIIAFAFLPLYTAWRIGAAVRALRMVGDKPWIRTQRHKHRDA
jgi:cellulose synthase/poly-beta-1,6-N-acetylglucosamine synthase-like glycosyltransferase